MAVAAGKAKTIGVVLAVLLLLNLAAALLLQRLGQVREPPLRVDLSGRSELLAGGTAGLAVQVTAPDGIGQADCPLEIRVGGAAPQFVRTDASGRAAVAAPVPTTPGEAELLLVAGQGAGRTALRQTVRVRVRHRVLWLVDRDQIAPGETVHWLARVVSAGTGQPVSGAPLVVEWSRRQADSPQRLMATQHATTDGAGVAHGRFRTAPGDAYELVGEVSSGEPVAGRATVSLRIEAPAPTLMLAPDQPSFRAGQPVALTVKAADAAGWPVDGPAVEVSAAGVSTTARLRHGVARVSLPALPPGETTVQAAAKVGGSTVRASAAAAVTTAGQPLYEARLEAVDGPLVRGEAVLCRLQVLAGGRPAATVRYRLLAGSREISEGETDRRGSALFDATWADGELPVVSIEGGPASPVAAEFEPAEDSIRLRLHPPDGVELPVEVRSRRSGLAVLELVRDGFAAAAVTTPVGPSPVTVALPMPAHQTGYGEVVARHAGAADEAVTVVPFVRLDDATGDADHVATLLVAAAPPPSGWLPWSWPIDWLAAGLAPPSGSVRQALRRVAVEGQDSFWWPLEPGLAPPTQAAAARFAADARQLAVQAAAGREAEVRRWAGPGLWTEVLVLLAFATLSLAAQPRLAARVGAVLLPLAAGAWVARRPELVPVAALLAALAAVCAAGGTWPAWILTAVAGVIAALAAGADDGSVLLLSAAACALAATTAILRPMAAQHPRRATLLAALVACGTYAVVWLSLADVTVPGLATTVAAPPSESPVPAARGGAVCGPGWPSPTVWRVGDSNDEVPPGSSLWRVSFASDGAVRTQFQPAAAGALLRAAWPEELVVGDEAEVGVEAFLRGVGPAAANYTVEVDSTRLDLRSAPARTVQLEPGTTLPLPLRLRAVKPGPARISATLTPADGAAAVRLAATIQVLADGLPRVQEVTRRIGTGQTIEIVVPEGALPGSSRLQLTLCSGLEAWARPALARFTASPQPGLVGAAAGLLATAAWLPWRAQPEPGADAPELTSAALAYQSFVSAHEAMDEPADMVTEAWALLALGRYARSAAVDSAMLDDLAAAVRSSQLADGSWPAAGDTSAVAVTALATWALSALPQPPATALQPAVAWLTEALDGEPLPLATLAWVANALLQADPGALGAREAVERLAARATEPGTPPDATPLGSYGAAARAEVQAAVVLALLRAGNQPELAASCLDELLPARAPDGSCGSPAATALAIVAAQAAADSGGGAREAAVQVRVNDGPATVYADDGRGDGLTTDLTRRLRRGANTIMLRAEGGHPTIASLRYDHALAWPRNSAGQTETLTGAVLPRAVEPGRPVTVTWHARSTRPSPAGWRLTITSPPGWRLDAAPPAGAVVTGQHLTLTLPSSSELLDVTLPLRYLTGRAFRGSGPRATLQAVGWPERQAVAGSGTVTVQPQAATPATPPGTVLR